MKSRPKLTARLFIGDDYWKEVDVPSSTVYPHKLTIEWLRPLPAMGKPERSLKMVHFIFSLYRGGSPAEYILTEIEQ